MIHARDKHGLVVLADGTVLAVGGSTTSSLISQTGVLDAELWNPDSQTWTLMAAMHDQRMYHLSVQTPANSNLAPPGYYMLFIVDSSGVPSVAKIIKVSGGSSPSGTP